MLVNFNLLYMVINFKASAGNSFADESVFLDFHTS